MIGAVVDNVVCCHDLIIKFIRRLRLRMLCGGYLTIVTSAAHTPSFFLFFLDKIMCKLREGGRERHRSVCLCVCGACRVGILCVFSDFFHFLLFLDMVKPCLTMILDLFFPSLGTPHE